MLKIQDIVNLEDMKKIEPHTFPYTKKGSRHNNGFVLIVFLNISIIMEIPKTNHDMR